MDGRICVRAEVIRVHRNAALLLSAQPEALGELFATETMRVCLGPRLSSTAAWVDHQRIGLLREALLQAGYAPRVAADAATERPGNGGQDA
jgi:hypothetical protein